VDNTVAMTEIFSDLDAFKPATGSVYLFGTTPEARSAHSPAWEAAAPDVRFVRLADHSRWTADFDVDGQRTQLQLRNAASLKEFWRQFNEQTLYLDITGLGHHVWAPLLRAAVDTCSDVRVVYVEPVHYSRSNAPTEGDIFDLSERIGGIAPLPGFASFGTALEERFHLVVLVGFEGTRLAYLLENVQPAGGEVTPVIGAPGFRSEYPFYAYHGNKAPLLDSRAWLRVRYVTANCPFSAFAALEALVAEVGRPVKVAPIGTKPHSLGAVLYAIANPAVELVYDHPSRTAKRTIGASRALIYRVSPLLAAHASEA
jgi:hypothetical protein